MGGSSSAPAQEDAAASAPVAHVPAKDTVVDTNKVMAKKGAIPVSSRYCTTRALSADFSIENKVLGSGMSGPVQLAVGKADQRKYAVKSFKKKGLSPRRRNELKNEVEIYLELDHPHVVRLDMVFETDDELFIVMEFMAGGELYDRLAEKKRYDEQMAAMTTHQMLLAVAYLHGKSIAHRDLKLENFLYENKDTDVLKLIDFGFAKFKEGNKKMEQACGSVHYVAPEVLAHSYTEKADCWSIGIIVYMLLTGSPPFQGSDEEVLRKIRVGKPQFGQRFAKLSKNAQDFVQHLLVADPAKRLSANQALQHPFVSGREKPSDVVIDPDIVKNFRKFAHASHFRRATYAMMAWSLTIEQRAGIEKQFLMLDTEHKGTIKHSQFKSVLMENFHIDNAEAESLFSSLDTDNDEELSYSEFLAAIMHDRLKMHEDVLRKSFAKFDIDQNGTISKADLQKVLGDTFEGTDIDELIQEADLDKDGTISYNEFLAYFQQADDIEEEGPSEEAVQRRQKRKKLTEKLSASLDGMMPDHADPESPTVHGSKTPVMKAREDGALALFPHQHETPVSTPSAGV